MNYDEVITTLNSVNEKLTHLQGYQPRHSDTTNHIMETMVPDEGVSSTLQGELLRRLAALREEAQGTGNMKWHEGYYDEHCTFITATADEMNFRQVREVGLIIDKFRAHGHYAMMSIEEPSPIPKESFKSSYLAHVNDDLYDFIADTIAEFHQENGVPIPYDPEIDG